MKIAEHVGIRGPCCIQMKESSDGVIKLIEINPRFGWRNNIYNLGGRIFLQ